jgi:MFS transporter, SHS family, lactate transporter
MTAVQKRTFVACFLGWMLDAFDFFLVVFLLPDISKAFDAPIPRVAVATFLTLAFRPLGALIFGWFADRYGRRVPLMVDIGLFSFLELLTAFSPNLTFFIVVRALFGVAMGGEWGLGAALAMESLASDMRGVMSGLLQEGYAVGSLLASVSLALFLHHVGWRGMFIIGALPALLIVYIRTSVPESPVWEAGRAERLNVRGDVLIDAIKRNWVLFIYGILLMSAFNFLSHGSQDPYVTFLRLQRGFSPAAAFNLNSIAALGAIGGGIIFAWLSQRYGRRWTIVAACVLGILMLKIWVGGTSFWALALGGFVMQFAVQGAWGIIPAHLNEIAPGLARGTFPGFVYQIGNLIASPTLPILTSLAATRFVLPNGGADYATAMLIFVGITFVAVIVFTLLGFGVVPERREAALTSQASV